ncbi:hypothetical protein QR680_007691 [Steinernema hermaphroditum]|uniref:Uncharacterized protein n=1 Tax=Steinernema hermaphroditum TaxID=289476 RepID=A0AA39IFD6_9BILA|nr:hypothetical protein QR680_007691 [Steinernema hermaphroditum]
MEALSLTKLLVTSLERIATEMNFLEARLTSMESLHERLLKRQRRTEDRVMAVLEGFHRRFEVIENRVTETNVQKTVPARVHKTHVSLSPVKRAQQESAEITIRHCPRATTSLTVLEPKFTTASVELAFEQPCQSEHVKSLFKIRSITESVSYTPITEPWRRSKQPWTRRRKGPRNVRRFTSLLNRVTLENSFAKEIGDLWHENEHNRKTYFGLMIDGVLQNPRLARVYMNAFHEVLDYERRLDRENYSYQPSLFHTLARRAEVGCMHPLSTLPEDRAVMRKLFYHHCYPKIDKKVPPKDKYMMRAKNEKAEEETKANRQRLCGLLMIISELQKHGIVRDKYYIDLILTHLRACRESPLGNRDCYNPAFAMKWLLVLRKKFKGGFFEYDGSYRDDFDNNGDIPRSTPRWKNKTDGAVISTINRATLASPFIDDLRKYCKDHTSRSDDDQLNAVRTSIFLATHLVRAALANSGKNAEFIGSYAVLLAQDHIFGATENDLLDDVIDEALYEMGRRRRGLSAADGKLEISGYLITVLRLIGSIFSQDLEDPQGLLMKVKDLLERRNVLDNIESENRENDAFFSCLFKWVKLLESQILSS